MICRAFGQHAYPASVVGTLVLCLLGKNSLFQQQHSHSSLIFSYLQTQRAAIRRRGWQERGWVPISCLSLNAAAVQTLKKGITSLCLSVLIRHLAHVTRLL